MWGGSNEEGYIMTAVDENMRYTELKNAVEARQLNTGRKYRHFKGKEYLVLHRAKHSETLEELVVYEALYAECGIWVRPLEMFLDQVELKGKLVNRFEEIVE
jgi:hypothetical protein